MNNIIIVDRIFCKEMFFDDERYSESISNDSLWDNEDKRLNDIIISILSLDWEYIKRDFINDIEQNKEIKDLDFEKLNSLYKIGIDLDSIITIILNSTKICESRAILKSKLNKNAIISILETPQIKLQDLSQTTSFREDMYRIALLYPYNIHLSDLTGFIGTYNNTLISSKNNILSNSEEGNNILSISKDGNNILSNSEEGNNIPSIPKEENNIPSIPKEENNILLIPKEGNNILIIPKEEGNNILSNTEEENIIGNKYFKLGAIDEKYDGLQMIRIFIPGYNTEDCTYLNIKIMDNNIQIYGLFGIDSSKRYLFKLMKKYGIFDGQWIVLNIIYSRCKMIETIFNWFRKYDINNCDFKTNIGRICFDKYICNIFELLWNLSWIKNDEYLVQFSKFESYCNISYLFQGMNLLSAEYYLYRNHNVDNIYSLDVVKIKDMPLLKWSLVFNDKLSNKNILHPARFIIDDEDKNNTMHYYHKFISDVIYDNEISRSLFETLATSPISLKHQHIISILISFWEN